MPFRRAEPGWSGMRAGCHWRIATASSVPPRRILCRGGAGIRSFRNKMSHTSRIVMKKALPVGSAFRLAGLCRYPGAGSSHEGMRRSDVSAGATGGQASDRFPGRAVWQSVAAIPPFLPSAFLGLLRSFCPPQDAGLYPDDGGQAAKLNVSRLCGRIGEAEEKEQRSASF